MTPCENQMTCGPEIDNETAVITPFWVRRIHGSSYPRLLTLLVTPGPQQYAQVTSPRLFWESTKAAISAKGVATTSAATMVPENI